MLSYFVSCFVTGSIVDIGPLSPLLSALTWTRPPGNRGELITNAAKTAILNANAILGFIYLLPFVLLIKSDSNVFGPDKHGSLEIVVAPPIVRVRTSHTWVSCIIGGTIAAIPIRLPQIATCCPGSISAISTKAGRIRGKSRKTAEPDWANPVPAPSMMIRNSYFNLRDTIVPNILNYLLAGELAR